jgi:type I restriction enzyme R subunit
MWLPGFDAPTDSTLYLDKPMKDHTLMQTIARANRVTSHQVNGVAKENGEIVDYYNVFRNMKKALKDYAQRQKGLDDAPVKEKAELFVLLDDAIEQGLAYCQGKGVDWGALLERDEVFKSIRRFKEYVDTLLSQDEWCKESNV